MKKGYASFRTTGLDSYASSQGLDGSEWTRPLGVISQRSRESQREPANLSLFQREN